jgi:ribosomal protein S18 acetylase RimI-like enzyme
MGERPTMRSSAGGRAAGGPRAAYHLRIGDPGDAPRAASLHAALISEGFLSSLGESFLVRLYGRITRSPGSFLLVAEAGARPAGFVAGSVALGRLYRDFLVHDGVVAAAGAARRLSVTWPRALETLRHAAHGRSQRGDGGGELLAIAVDPAWRGRGVGLVLVDGFLAQLARRDVSVARVVVGAHNTPAVSLYERAGFRTEQRIEVHRGTASLLMARAVSDEIPTPRPEGG